MTTRATLTFTDHDESHSIYQHADGYPDGKHGVLACVENAKIAAFELPRFEADEFAAAYVAVNKGGRGNIRLIKDPSDIGDASYHYDITCVNGELKIEWKECN